MEFGMIGLSRMGADMVQCILAAGHRSVVYDRSAEVVQALKQTGAADAYDLDELITELEPTRRVCTSYAVPVWTRRGRRCMPRPPPWPIRVSLRTTSIRRRSRRCDALAA